MASSLLKNKFLWIGALFLVVAFFGVGSFIGLPTGWGTMGLIATGLVTLVAIAGLSAVGVLKFMNPKQSLVLAVVGIVGIAFMAGWIAMPTGATLGAGTIAGSTQGAQVSTSCGNPNTIGNTANLTIIQLDKANASLPNPTTATFYVAEGVSSVSEVTSSTPLTTAVTTAYQTGTIGSKVLLVGYGTGFYSQPRAVEICTAQSTITQDVYHVVAETGIQTTLYDSSGTVLTTGTVNNSDYTFAMAQSEETLIKAKVKVNSVDVAYQLGGIATVVFNDISSVAPIDSDFTTIATPLYLKNQLVSINKTASDISTANGTISSTYTVYKLASPIMMNNYMEKTFDLRVEASGTANPADASGTTTVDGFGILWQDVTYTRGSDGKLYQDIHDHTSSEATVGVAENVTDIYGRTSGALVSIS